eukprot:9330926-Ditylum_brightwellii.AAC.1
MGISDGIEEEWHFYEGTSPLSDVGDENNQVKPQSPLRLRRSTRDKKLTQRSLESMEQEDLQFNIAIRAQYYEAQELLSDLHCFQGLR